MVKVQTVASSLASYDSATCGTIFGWPDRCIDVGEPIVERVDDLVGVERRVQRRVDVLGRIADKVPRSISSPPSRQLAHRWSAHRALGIGCVGTLGIGASVASVSGASVPSVSGLLCPRYRQPCRRRRRRLRLRVGQLRARLQAWRAVVSFSREVTSP